MSAGEILLIFFVALMLFGSKSLPGFARSLGRAYREFKRATEDIKQEIAQNADIAGIKKDVEEIRDNISGSFADVNKSIVNEADRVKTVVETSVVEKKESLTPELAEEATDLSADDYQHSVYKQAAEQSEKEMLDEKLQNSESAVETSSEKNIVS